MVQAAYSPHRRRHYYNQTFCFSSRRRHPRSTRDWSSDVCSSDLPEMRKPSALPADIFLGKYLRGEHSVSTFLDNTHFILPLFAHISKSFAAGEFPYWINSIEIGRASCRERR